jgi:hypothetical protein
MFLFALFVFLPLDILYCSYNYISTGKKIIIVDMEKLNQVYIKSN